MLKYDIMITVFTCNPNMMYTGQDLNIITCWWQDTGFGVLIGFTGPSWLVTIKNYAASANLHTYQITIAHAISFCYSLSWSLLGNGLRCALHVVRSSASVLTSSLDDSWLATDLQSGPVNFCWSSPAHTTLVLVIRPRVCTHLIGGLVGPRAGLDTLE
jgi:hypothetical protein